MREKIGSTVGASLVAGFLFLQCVYPLFRDDSVLRRCDDPELAAQCDADRSLANFFVRICGRSEVFVREDLVENVSGDPGVRYPPDTIGEMGCGERVYIRWELPDGEAAGSYEELRSYFAGSTSDATAEIYEDWVRSEISTGEAARLLVMLSVE